MKLDLGVVEFSVADADPFVPSMVVSMGREDVYEPPSASLTMTKTKAVRYRRTFAMYFGQLPPDADVSRILSNGIVDIQKRMGGRVVHSEDRKVNGAPAKHAIVQHLLEGTPMVSFLLVSIQSGLLSSITLSALDSPKTKEEVKAQFEGVVGSLRPGALAVLAATPLAAPAAASPAAKKTGK